MKLYNTSPRNNAKQTLQIGLFRHCNGSLLTLCAVCMQAERPSVEYFHFCVRNRVVLASAFPLCLF